jgi:hypothetical protein
MRIAFIPSAYRTLFFREVGARLERAGHEVFWLSPNRRWARWLEQRGTPGERIFDITRWGEEWTERAADEVVEGERIAELEARGTLALNNIILMDPLLLRRSRSYALSYLGVCAREIQGFLAGNGIDVVSGEQTWAFELLAGQVCVAEKIPFLNPHTIRIPDPRFAFFVNHTEATVLELGAAGAPERREAEARLHEFRQREPQPTYMAINRSVVQPRASRLELLTRHVLDLAGDRYDETSRRPLGLIANHAAQLLRRRWNLLRAPFELPQMPPERPYVLFPLHKQPEASVDIKGAPYNNQVELLRTLARTLPSTHDLLVKEHDFALYTRPPGFYRELSKLPGVRLVHPRADIFRLTRAADLVVTVTGTAAYEAALLGRRAATIAPIFFERLVSFPRFDPFEDSLARLLQEPAQDDDQARIDFLAWLIAQSCPGLIGDALWLPQSMEPENVEGVAEGFERALAALGLDA